MDSSSSSVPLQVVVGNPPSNIMQDAIMASPFGVVMAGKESAPSQPALNGTEVKLAYGMGEWTAQIARMLHDADVDPHLENHNPRPAGGLGTSI